MEHGIGAAEQVRLRGDEGAEISFCPFGAVWPGHAVGDHMIDKDKPLDHFILAVEPRGTAYRHGCGKPAADKSVCAGNKNICHLAAGPSTFQIIPSTVGQLVFASKVCAVFGGQITTRLSPCRRKIVHLEFRCFVLRHLLIFADGVFIYGERHGNFCSCAWCMAWRLVLGPT